MIRDCSDYSDKIDRTICSKYAGTTRRRPRDSACLPGAGRNHESEIVSAPKLNRSEKSSPLRGKLRESSLKRLHCLLGEFTVRIEIERNLGFLPGQLHVHFDASQVVGLIGVL